MLGPSSPNAPVVLEWLGPFPGLVLGSVVVTRSVSLGFRRRDPGRLGGSFLCWYFRGGDLDRAGLLLDLRGSGGGGG